MTQTSTASQSRKRRLLITTLIIVITGPALAQVENQIVTVDPSSAEPGTSGLLVSFTLDTDTPPPPPAGALPDSAGIGSISGSALTHESQYIVTALFDIPASEPTGAKDCSVVFTTPQGTVSFSLSGGFSVTAGDAPPVISQQPASQTVSTGDPVSFTVVADGTEPLAYQWQKDGSDLGGETAPTLSVAAVGAADAGDYRCLVSNVYGSALSDPATLSIDISVQTVPAPYPVVDSMLDLCYDDLSVISCPAAGQAFAGQDAQHSGYQAQYSVVSVGGDVIVEDLVTGLSWEPTTDINGDGTIDAADKLTWSEAQDRPAALNAEAYGGYTDWRLPSIKELYSLFDARGTDPSAESSASIPFIDTTVFEFGFGDESAGERVIDAQYASSTVSVATAGQPQMFGVNFADGRIKGYGFETNGGGKTFYVQCVRGNPDYGVNDLADNGDGTITDRATGLMWDQYDNGSPVTWKQALAWVESKNSAGHRGYSDWRLPNTKELQIILDYSRSPATHGTAAIDPLFSTTGITNESCAADFPWYWSSTTHVSSNGHGDAGMYVCFGRALGYMNGAWIDVHGAGAQRCDRKDGDLSSATAQDCGYYSAFAPQGDAARAGSFVRLVRGGNGPLLGDFSWEPASPAAGESLSLTATASGATTPYSFAWDLAGTPDSGATAQVALPAGTHSIVLTIIDAAGLASTVTRQITVGGSADQIFANGFESGDLSAWSGTGF